MQHLHIVGAQVTSATLASQGSWNRLPPLASPRHTCPDTQPCCTCLFLLGEARTCTGLDLGRGVVDTRLPQARQGSPRFPSEAGLLRGEVRGRQPQIRGYTEIFPGEEEEPEAGVGPGSRKLPQRRETLGVGGHSRAEEVGAFLLSASHSGLPWSPGLHGQLDLPSVTAV